MMKLAALIHFKPGVSEENARHALEHISRVLEVPQELDFDKNEFKDTTVGDYVQEYDDSYGGPVWYIP